jgi:ribose-phosphate pyrophosphokinase
VTPRVVAGSSSVDLAAEVSKLLGIQPVEAALDPFPDGERHVLVDDLRGDDVYVVQSTGPPVNDHLVELLLLLDACTRSGASRVTAVVPYLGYARHDRRTRAGQAIGARVVAHALAQAGADRLVSVDPHGTGLESMSSVPVESLSAIPTLTAAVRLDGLGVVVAPDLGAVRLAERFAGALGLPVAVVRKTRTSGTEVRAEELVGDVSGRRPIVVDDMIATGATIEAAARLAGQRGAAAGLVVAAAHGVFVGEWPETLHRLCPSRVVVTDTLGSAGVVTDTLGSRGAGAAVERLSIAPLLCDAIARLHREEALDDLAFPGDREREEDGHGIS